MLRRDFSEEQQMLLDACHTTWLPGLCHRCRAGVRLHGVMDEWTSTG